MFSTIDDILDAYKVTDYVHQHHAYDSGETIGFVDRDTVTAIWFRYIPGSFWYFDGRTSADFLHRQTHAMDIHRCFWKQRPLNFPVPNSL